MVIAKPKFKSFFNKKLYVILLGIFLVVEKKVLLSRD